MIRNIELDALVQILIAAEQGSFHRAGSLLGVRTSTISRRVRQLEGRIGVSLFERHRHGIRPTEAGKAFLANTRRIIDDVEALLTDARTVGRGESGWLRIGLYVSLSRGPLREALATYMARYAGVEVRIIDETRSQLMEDMNRGAVDIVILAGQIRGSMPHQVLPLWTERVLLAVPEDHRLARKSIVTWDDLRGERILLATRDPGPGLRDLLVAHLGGVGMQPRIIYTRAQRDTLIGMVGFRRALTLLYGSNAGVRHPGVVYRELVDPGGRSRLRYFACWDSRNTNPALQQFLSVLGDQDVSVASPPVSPTQPICCLGCAAPCVRGESRGRSP
jgi:DNA-binding transcriptional LysR family regulator